MLRRTRIPLRLGGRATRLLGSELESVNTIVRGAALSTDAAILELVTSCHKPVLVGDGGAAAAFRAMEKFVACREPVR